MKKELKFKVNGNPYDLYIEPKTLLVQVLRDMLGLTGTKRGCSDSSCGACTVIMDGMSVKSCSVLALQANGSEVTTVEGLAKGNKLSEIQRAFLDHGAYQCGFCTPGMLMSARALLDRSPQPTEEEIRAAFVGNLCRCTGYRRIVRAVERAAKSGQNDKVKG